VPWQLVDTHQIRDDLIEEAADAPRTSRTVDPRLGRGCRFQISRSLLDKTGRNR
jgi:hypothetical protein